MASMWTAPSDLDYYEGGFASADAPVDESQDEPENEDCDYDHVLWLLEHGYLTQPTDMELEEMRADWERRHPPVVFHYVTEEDDIAF